MQINQIHLVYYSATYTTRKISRLITRHLGHPTVEYDVTDRLPQAAVECLPHDLLVVGIPVYAGRVPQKAAAAIQYFQGNQTPVVLIAVYGNRDYDDALIELKDITLQRGFKPIAAAAFIAQHSMFSKVAAHRPDAQDEKIITQFAQAIQSKLMQIEEVKLLLDLEVPGQRPYKVPGRLPVLPLGDDQCIACGKCVRLCPEQAISIENPRQTAADKCILCGRCIFVCPTESRQLQGENISAIRTKFETACSARKEPEIFLVG